MNAELMRAEIERVRGVAQQMLAEHQVMKDALIKFTAEINNTLGELRAYEKLLADLEKEDGKA